MTSNAPSETTTVPTERYERMIAEIRDFSGRLKAENPCSLWNATAHETGKLRKS